MFTSQYKIQANYVMLLEKELFNELIFMDYLDTYEFKNTTLQLDKGQGIVCISIIFA